MRTLKAVADPMRLRILSVMAEEELSVGEVQEIVQAGQSSVSRNLGILRDAGFVRDRKEGTNVYFGLRGDMPTDAEELLRSLRSCFTELPEAKSDLLRLEECRRRRIVRSRNYFESIAGDWERIRKSYFDDRITSLAIEKLLPADLTVADVGCGTGSLSFELARFSGRVVGFDLSKEMIRRAKRHAKETGITNVDFRLGDAEKLPARSGRMDGAFCVMVLHFLTNPARAVRELGRITRRGGSVIIVDLVPHDQAWMRKEMAHSHLGFSENQIQAWFRAAGAKHSEYELTGTYAGKSLGKNGKRAVEIFVARGLM